VGWCPVNPECHPPTGRCGALLVGGGSHAGHLARHGE